jgi:uncharacterized membrane protein YfcA
MISFDMVFLIAIVAGLFGALTGLGGGTVMVPVLTYLGVDIKLAIAASMISVIATSCSSASLYLRQGLVNLKTGMYLEMFTIVGAVIGASITLVTGSEPLFIAFGAILILAGILLFARDRIPGKKTSVPAQDRLSRSLELQGRYEDQAEQRQIVYFPVRPGVGGPLMVFAGMISGLLGIGAGAFKVLVQDLIMGIPTKVSTSTSNLIIGVTALAGSSVYMSAGLVDPTLAVPIILGVTIGATGGTFLLQRMTNKTVRRYFIIVVILIGLDMIRRGVL